jgi:hypothetical protein
MRWVTFKIQSATDVQLTLLLSSSMKNWTAVLRRESISKRATLPHLPNSFHWRLDISEQRIPLICLLMPLIILQVHNLHFHKYGTFTFNENKQGLQAFHTRWVTAVTTMLHMHHKVICARTHHGILCMNYFHSVQAVMRGKQLVKVICQHKKTEFSIDKYYSDSINLSRII